MSGLIDVHQHLVPPDYRAAVDAATGGSVGGIPQPDWDETSMLERMQTLHIERAVLSVSAPALARYRPPTVRRWPGPAIRPWPI